jgi:hypothetical protein
VNKHDTPSDPCTIVHADPDSPPRKQEWKYHLLLGLLSYLTAITCADIVFAVNNCARFSTKPRGIHEISLKWIVKYLLTTPTQGMVYRPNWTKGLKFYVESDFAGNFCPPGDPERIVLITVRLRHHVQQLPHHLGQQASNFSSLVYL